MTHYSYIGQQSEKKKKIKLLVKAKLPFVYAEVLQPCMTPPIVNPATWLLFHLSTVTPPQPPLPKYRDTQKDAHQHTPQVAADSFYTELTH